MYLQDNIRIFTHIADQENSNAGAKWTSRPFCGQQASELEILLASSVFFPFVLANTRNQRSTDISPGTIN